jgi:hypothetical protein
MGARAAAALTRCWPCESELCSPRLIASRATCASAAFGLSAGFWPQGQSKHSTPEANLGGRFLAEDPATSGKTRAAQRPQPARDDEPPEVDFYCVEREFGYD